MVKIGVIGHTGRLGKPLVDILNEHPYAEIVYTESRREGSKGKLDDTEFIFLTLPYGESEQYLGYIERKRAIDLSIDHRYNYPWVYGLPELNKEQIRNAQYVANPGCYATSIILGLAPIFTAKRIFCNVTAASTSGISGAGMEVQKEDNFLVYKEGKEHPQLPEILKTLPLGEIVFVPQRIDTADRGIISTIFGTYHPRHEEADLVRLYQKFYESSPFIRMKENIETKNVNGTNFCDIKIGENAYLGGNIYILSALDNLIKGGAGQAIQNFNIMHGFEETTGLL